MAPSTLYRNSIVTDQNKLLTTGYGIDLNKDGYNYKSNLQYGHVIPTSDSNALATVNNGVNWLYKQSNYQVYLGSATSLYDQSNMFATCSAQPTDHGDSGGPIFYQKNNGDYILIGDTSWGLTISNGYNGYWSYNFCINHQGENKEGTKLSVFTDLSYKSTNYQLLEKYLTQINEDRT